MSLIGNIIWLIFGGFLTGLGYIISGLILCLTLIGIPFGWQSIKLGFATMTPFGRQIIEEPGASSLLTTVFNVIWLLFFGWEIALSHAIWGLLLFITIVGIPFAKQHFKLLPLSLFPFGRELR